MQRLKITNLYEDAYFGMATYFYARKWGDETQQLEGLQRAIAEDDQAHFLPGDLFKWALQVSLQLQVKQALYAEALEHLPETAESWAWTRRPPPGSSRWSRNCRRSAAMTAVMPSPGRCPRAAGILPCSSGIYQAEVSEASVHPARQVKLRRREELRVHVRPEPNQIASKDAGLPHGADRRARHEYCQRYVQF